MSWNSKNIDRDELYQMYFIDVKPIREIAQRYQCCIDTIKTYLKKFNIPKRRKPTFNITNLVGKTFGEWLVLRKGKSTDRLYWVCECNICKSEHEVSTSHLNSGVSTKCFQCAKIKNRQYVGNISKSLYGHIKYRAKRANLKFSISQKYLWELFINQSGKCAISGIDISLPEKSDDLKNGNRTASLDRIDSSKGYIEGNVQWLHKHINLMKWMHDDQTFIYYAHLIANNNPLYW